MRRARRRGCARWSTAGIPAAPLTARERLERAERLLSGGQHAVARAEAETLLAETWPADVTMRAYRVVAESWRRTGRVDEALRVVDRAHRLGAGRSARAAGSSSARSLTRRAATRRWPPSTAFCASIPEGPEAPEALLLRAQILEGAPAAAEAEAALARLAADYPDSEEASTALWRLGWVSWLRGTPAVAAERWTRLVALRAGQRLRDAAEYWIARARAERGRRGRRAPAMGQRRRRVAAQLLRPARRRAARPRRLAAGRGTPASRC